MIYHGVNDEFVSYISNPVNSRITDVKVSFFYDFFLKFYKLRKVKKFKDYALDKLISELTENVVNELQDLKMFGSLGGRIDVKDVKEFYRLIVAVDEKARNEINEKSILKYIDDQLVTTYMYHAERISENFEVSRFSRGILSLSNIWILYFISEYYILYKMGVVDFDCHKEGFKFKINSKYKSQYQAHALAEVSEQSSVLADRVKILSLSPYITTGLVCRNYLDIVIDHFIDKLFSVKAELLEDTTSNQKTYMLVRDISGLLIVLEFFFLNGKDLPVRYILDSKICDEKTFDLLLEYLRSSEHKFKMAFLDGRNIKKGDLDFHVGFKKSILSFVSFCASKNYVSNKISINWGGIFEKGYMYRYISTLSNRFKIYPEIMPKTGDSSLKYDIDFVIEDLQFNQFYFCQVKHLQQMTPKSLVERIQCLKNTKSLEAAISQQIKGFKDNFHDPKIRSKFSNKKYFGLEKSNLDNSHFLLIQNLPFLNLYKIDGILIFEWNFLRNIMQNCRLFTSTTDNIISSPSFKSKVMLHDVDEIVDIYSSGDYGLDNIAGGMYLFNNMICQLECKLPSGTKYIDFPHI